MKFKTLMGALAIAACVGVVALPASAAQKKLKVNTWPNLHHNIVDLVVVTYTKLIENATGGQVRFDIPAGSLAAGGNIYDAVVAGAIDLSFFIPDYTPARFPTSRALELPLSTPSSYAASVTYQKAQDKFFSKTGEYDEIKLLGVWDSVPSGAFTRTEVKTLGDLKGLKIRVGGGTATDVAKAVGAVPLAVPATEAFEMLSKGTADGIFFPPEGLLTFNLLGLVHYYYEVPGSLYSSTWGMAMNKKTWDGFPKDIQQEIEGVSGLTISKLAGRQWDVRQQLGIKAAAKANIKTNVASPEDVAKIKAIGDQLEAKWIKDVAKLGVDGKAAMTFIRAELKANSM